MYGDSFIGANRMLAIAEVAKHGLVAIWSGSQIFADSGGLITYAADPIPNYQGGGEYGGLVLNGAKPGDLPIQVATAELTVNLKTAKAMGITVPAIILAAADRGYPNNRDQRGRHEAPRFPETRRCGRGIPACRVGAATGEGATDRVAFDPSAVWMDGVTQSLTDYGYVDGTTATLEYFTAPTTSDLPAFAAKAVASKPDIILAFMEYRPAWQLGGATSTIPIVFPNAATL